MSYKSDEMRKSIRKVVIMTLKKKGLAILLITAGLLGAYGMGNSHGEKSVLDNQVITNEEHAQGNYKVEYKGETINYWYEIAQGGN